MPQFDQLLLIYLHLAHASQLRRQLPVRDKLLVLAGMTALELDRGDISATCRERILLHNPRHLLRRWPDLATAARAERFRSYLKQLRRKYSPEKAEHMLHSLGISLDDPPQSDWTDGDRAAMLIDSLALVADDRQVAPAAAQRAMQRQVRRLGTSSAAGPSGAASWWPFWLGVGLWIVLALLGLFGSGRSG